MRRAGWLERVQEAKQRRHMRFEVQVQRPDSKRPQRPRQEVLLFFNLIGSHRRVLCRGVT